MRLACLTLALLGLTASAAEDARAIVDAADERHRLPAERTRSRMTLQEKDGPARERVMESWSLTDKKTGDRLRIKFHSPADVQGTGLLSLENVSGGDDEQWLYLPAFKKTRRVAQSELGDRFMGTDLFYEDMKRRHTDDYTHKLLPEEKVEGQDCWVIESTPSAPKVVKESPYGRSMTWVRKDNYFIVRVRLFDKKLEPLKQIDVTGLKKVSGTAWRADQTTVVDVKRKHRTLITVLEREAKALSPDVFTRRELESE